MENEISNRQRCYGGEKDQSTSIDSDIIEDITVMLDSNNVLVRSYRMRDIVVQTKTGFLQHISELHPSYLPLEYPLLIPYGDDGYSVNILYKGVSFTTNNKRAKCTMREYFSFRIQDRDHSFSLILNSKKLFQQFLVDAYTMMETERLNCIRRQQHVLRCESYENLRNQKAQGTINISSVGQPVILPSSFTGGARYMLQNYLDAMSLCKWLGYPIFFINFMCNPKWTEIKGFLKDTSLQPEDRPDILCRLFKINLDAFIKDLRENQIFIKVQYIFYILIIFSFFAKYFADVYTIEFQKRCLLHSHICLFMHSDNKLPTIEFIDPIISAEILDKIEEPEFYSLVNEFMIHGPCGAENINYPCMVDKKCSKNIPKQFCNHSSVNQNGFPLYKRRNNGHFVEKSGVKLDNRNITHINVEWCNQGSSIKYLFKYINKDPDRATVVVVQTNNECENNNAVDEIAEYYDCRYLSACEASWRIFKYDVHCGYPFMVKLPFHLPSQQQIVCGEDDDIDDVLDKPFVAASKFTSWMECNAINSETRELTYVEFPKILFGKVGKTIGRIHSVLPNLGEAYFLRIILNKVKGPTSFDEIRMVNGETYSSFRNACYALRLLDDNKEYIDAIKEASHAGSVFFLHFLFATLLMCNSMSKPEDTWENTWEYLADGILYNQRKRFKSPDLSLSEDELKNLTLFEIEKFLL
uniref:Helitron helicase-like domain-containing protein n=1 Tax=Lactuca sativa TaxID=4236 RepID=A0A9R1XSH3_LACSA|nr:hypothetical protein LSAT_V11C200065090 [Lactuca sativa]